MIRRLLLLAALPAGVAAAFVLFAPSGAIGPLAPHDAQAVGAGQVVGSYQLKLVGEAWRQKGDQYSAERVRGLALLELRRQSLDVNDGAVAMRITLDPELLAGVFGEAVTDPAFDAKATLAGDSLAAIASGSEAFVNAVNLRFEKDGKKVQGLWLGVFPAGSAESGQTGFASGFGITVKGLRLARAADRPEPLR